MPEVYAARLGLVARPGRDPARSFLDAIRQWIGPRWPTDRPWLTLDESAGVRAEDGSIFRWEPFVGDSTLLLEFTWRHPHVEDAAITWSTQAAFYSAGQAYRIIIRVSNTGPELGEPNALPTTRPRLATILCDHFAVRTDGYNCNLEGRFLNEATFPDFVRYELFDSRRKYPLVLLTPATDGNYEVAPQQIAREFFTLGEVVVAQTPQSTFALTREVGRRELSCFRGALRVYLPGLRRDSDPFKHPLLTPRFLKEPADRLRLAQYLAARLIQSFRVDPRFHELRDERALKNQEHRSNLLQALEKSRSSTADLAEWRDLAESYAKDNRELKEQVSALEDQLAEAEQKIGALRYALGERRRAQGEPSELEPEFLPNTVLEAVEFAREVFSEMVRILPSAVEAAAESPYTRPEEVWRALRAIEAIGTKLSAGPLGQNPKDAFQALGFDYSPGLASTTPRRIRDQYRFREGGEEFQCEEHLRLGGGAYDPRNCLRIYFSTEPNSSPAIVIGHVGRHLDVISTT